MACMPAGHLQRAMPLGGHRLFSFALPTSVDAHDHPSRLLLTEAGRRSSFLAALPGSVIQDYQDHDIAMHNHFYGEVHLWCTLHCFQNGGPAS